MAVYVCTWFLTVSILTVINLPQMSTFTSVLSQFVRSKALVVLVNALCFTIHNYVTYVQGRVALFSSADLTTATKFYISLYVSYGSGLNVSCNAYIYAWRSTEYRHAFLKVLKLLFQALSTNSSRLLASRSTAALSWASRPSRVKACARASFRQANESTSFCS